VTAISIFSKEIINYCDNVSHIVGFLKSIVRRYSFSKKSKKLITFLDNIENSVLFRITDPLGLMKEVTVKSFDR